MKDRGSAHVIGAEKLITGEVNDFLGKLVFTQRNDIYSYFFRKQYQTNISVIAPNNRGDCVGTDTVIVDGVDGGVGVDNAIVTSN